MSPVIGTENDLGIVESADTIGLGDFELLTVASLAGLFRTASANPIEDINRLVDETRSFRTAAVAVRLRARTPFHSGQGRVVWECPSWGISPLVN
jgi:hypothetical protein